MTSLLASMTGFARTEGTADGLTWAWELRSVNGRGLDLRFRLPPGWDALEPPLREAAGKALKRGNVTANLSVKREKRITPGGRSGRAGAGADPRDGAAPPHPRQPGAARRGAAGAARRAAAGAGRRTRSIPARRRGRLYATRWRRWWPRGRPKARGWLRR